MTFQNLLFGTVSIWCYKNKQKKLKETKSLAVRAYNTQCGDEPRIVYIYGERLGSSIFSPLHVIMSFQLFSIFF